MSLLKGFIGRLVVSHTVGNEEKWLAASEEERAEYEERIKGAVENGYVQRRVLGEFYLVCDRFEEGEAVLYEAVVAKEREAMRAHYLLLDYYFINSDRINHPIFKRWLEVMELAVKEEDYNAEINLAHACRWLYEDLENPKFLEIIDRVIELFESAVSKRQENAAYKYGDFIYYVLGAEEMKSLHPNKYRDPSEAEKYYLQAIKDDEGTQFHDSSLFALSSFYRSNIDKTRKKALSLYLQDKEIEEELTKEMIEYYQKAIKYGERISDPDQSRMKVLFANILRERYEHFVMLQKMRRAGIELDTEIEKIANNCIEIAKITTDQEEEEARQKGLITMEEHEAAKLLNNYYFEQQELLNGKGIYLSHEVINFTRALSA